MQSYQMENIIQGPEKGKPVRHYYIEKYQDEKPGRSMVKKNVPMTRSVAVVGPDREIAHVEKSQYPNYPNEVPKRLKICKFKDDELQMMCGKNFKTQRSEWDLIQKRKDEKGMRYQESIEQASLQKQFH